MKRPRVILVCLFIAGVGTGVAVWHQMRLERRYLPQINAAAQRYAVDPRLVRAVIWRESRFNPNVRGHAQELGLMQIREAAAREWAAAEHVSSFAHEHCLDPGTNTLAGTFYLGQLMKRYGRTDNPALYALADYNAGHGNVVKWNTGPATTNSAVFLDQIGFPGTRSYVKSVMRRYALYCFLSRFNGT